VAQWAARLKVLPLGVKRIMASGRTSHHVHALDALWVESRLEKAEYHFLMLAADSCWLMDLLTLVPLGKTTNCSLGERAFKAPIARPSMVILIPTSLSASSSYS
jgi:hypothetical protein